MSKNKIQKTKNNFSKKELRILKYIITSIVIWGILPIYLMNNYMGYAFGFMAAFLIISISIKPKTFLKTLSFIKFKFDDYVGTFVIWLLYG